MSDEDNISEEVSSADDAFEQIARAGEELSGDVKEYPDDPSLDKEQNAFTRGLVQALLQAIGKKLKGAPPPAASFRRVFHLLTPPGHDPQYSEARYFLKGAGGFVPPEKAWYTKDDLDELISKGYIVSIIGDVE